MREFARRYSSPVVILISIALGFLLPEVGSAWKPYLSYLLMILMFLVTLNIEPAEIAQSLKTYRVVTTGLFTVFVLAPIMSIAAKPFFSPIVFTGTVLALSCPSAIATAFWAKTFKGDVPLALIISTLTNLLSILTIPVTMSIAIGTAVTVDAAWMTLNLAVIILIPMTVSMLLKGFVHIQWKRITDFTSKAEIALLVLLVWGSIAPAVAYARSDVVGFLEMNIFMLLTLAVLFAIAYFLGKAFGRSQAITIAIATTVKNAALSLVIGLTAFGPYVLLPLVANLIAQNLLLVPAKIILERK